MSRQYRFGTLAIVCLVALRMGVGWHFFKEGTKKLKDPDFSSKYFLRQAKGPLAGYFYDLIPDRYGEERLNKQRVLDDWKVFQDRVQRQLGFDEAQIKKAAAVFKSRSRLLNGYFADHAGDIKKHLLEVDRLRQARENKSTRDVSFQRNWINAKEAELWNKPTAWIWGIQSISQLFQDDLFAIATSAQNVESATPLLQPGKKTWTDHAVTWTVLGVGVLLLIGLFTRCAALVGAGFLSTVLLTQPFWVPESVLDYAYYQLVEVLALFLLAATSAGRFGGLDFFTSAMWANFRSPRERDKDELDT